MRNNKKRAGAYFGLHFDFHANDLIDDIGSFTKAEDIGRYLDEVKPDYIQLDTKGHPGYASYFTKHGTAAPGLTCDHLKIIREETEKRGIALIAHHSSLWDEVACKNNPQWAIVEKDGKVSRNFIDFNTEYTDKVFIPMIKELCGEYGFDGVWIDGDCWCVYENYKKENLEKFYKESGFDFVDSENPQSESHIAFRKFTREQFHEFIKYYCREIKKDYPDFEICSNTSFSSIHPVKPLDGIDFLSADIFDLKQRVTDRCFASHEKSWDIMSWGHPASIKIQAGNHGDSYAGKRIYSCNNHIERSLRMAAGAISLGGGFEIIGMMNDQGEIMTYDIPNMKKVAKFMNERKEFNHNSKPLKNAALWLSLENRERIKIEGIVCDFDDMDKALCDTFIDAGYPVDIVFDYHIDENKIYDHNVIIVPEMIYISDDKKQKLLEYVNKGGNLIVTGPKSCLAFSDTIDAKMVDYTELGVYLEAKSMPDFIAGVANSIIFEDYNGIEFADCFADKPVKDYKPVKATALTDYGKGKIAFIGWDIIKEYYQRRTYIYPKIMKDVLKTVDVKANAYLKSGTERVEIIPAEKDGNLLINVINTNEYYYFSIDTAYGEIPPLYDLEIAVRCEKKPMAVTLEPQAEAAEFTFDGEYAYVKIDKLHIHTIIKVEF